MKKLVCKECGSTDLRQLGNHVLCDNCEATYRVSEVKKLLQEVPDEEELAPLDLEEVSALQKKMSTTTVGDYPVWQRWLLFVAVALFGYLLFQSFSESISDMNAIGRIASMMLRLNFLCFAISALTLFFYFQSSETEHKPGLISFCLSLGGAFCSLVLLMIFISINNPLPSQDYIETFTVMLLAECALSVSIMMIRMESYTGALVVSIIAGGGILLYDIFHILEASQIASGLLGAYFIGSTIGSLFWSYGLIVYAIGIALCAGARNAQDKRALRIRYSSQSDSRADEEDSK